MRTFEGKQMQFTLSGEISNPEIPRAEVAHYIEMLINYDGKYRCHMEFLDENKVEKLKGLLEDLGLDEKTINEMLDKLKG